MKILQENPTEAIMTESKEKVDGMTIKSESLIKPMFFLNMIMKYSNPLSAYDMKRTLQLILIEYVGRCLSRYEVKNNMNTPFCDFFAESLENQEKKRDFINSYLKKIENDLHLNGSKMLQDYYTFEDLKKNADKLAREVVKQMKDDPTAKIPLKVNITKIESLRRLASAGDVSWFTMKVFARYMGITEDVIEELFNEQSVFIYTAYALKYRKSHERLTAFASSPINFEKTRSSVIEKVSEECLKVNARIFHKQFRTSIEKSWLDAYFNAHNEVVTPMTQNEIINKARVRGIEVTEENFDSIYRYNPGTGLLRNACQTKACPYYLHPNKTYNQHGYTERSKEAPRPFVHKLHVTAHDYCNNDTYTGLKVLKSINSKVPFSGNMIDKLSKEYSRLKVIYKENLK